MNCFISFSCYHYQFVRGIFCPFIICFYFFIPPYFVRDSVVVFFGCESYSSNQFEMVMHIRDLLKFNTTRPFAFFFIFVWFAFDTKYRVKAIEKKNGRTKKRKPLPKEIRFFCIYFSSLIYYFAEYYFFFGWILCSWLYYFADVHDSHDTIWWWNGVHKPMFSR